MVLRSPTRTHRDGPDYLNVLRVLDVPQAMAMAVEFRSVTVFDQDPSGWDYPAIVSKNLGWRENKFKVALPPAAGAQ